MIQSAARLTLWLSLLLACGLAACSGSGSRGPRPAENDLVLPAGGDRFYVFRPGGIELRTRAGTEETWPIPAEDGRPASVGIDLARGWAAVAYERRLRVLALGQGKPRELPAPWDAPPGTLALRGERMAVCWADGPAVGVFAVPKGTPEIARTDVTRWLDEYGLDELHYALPVDAGELLLVAHRRGGLTRGPRTVVHHIDTTHGDWGLVNERSFDALSLLHSCSSDGDSLYLGGVHEVARLTNDPRPQDLLQTLVVLRVDVATLRGEPVVREPQHYPIELSGLVAGRGMLAMIVNRQELRVFRIEEDVQRSFPVQQRSFPQPISVAWVSAAEVVVVVVGAAEPEIVAIPGAGG